MHTRFQLFSRRLPDVIPSCELQRPISIEWIDFCVRLNVRLVLQLVYARKSSVLRAQILFQELHLVLNIAGKIFLAHPLDVIRGAVAVQKTYVMQKNLRHIELATPR